MIILLIIFYIGLSILFILELFGFSYGTFSEGVNLLDLTSSFYYFDNGGNLPIEIEQAIEIERDILLFHHGEQLLSNISNIDITEAAKFRIILGESIKIFPQDIQLLFTPEINDRLSFFLQDHHHNQFSNLLLYNHEHESSLAYFRVLEALRVSLHA